MPDLKPSVIANLLDQYLLAAVDVISGIDRQSNSRGFFRHKLPQSIRLGFYAESRYGLRVEMIQDKLADVGEKVP
jgi:hypothetical protein